MTNELLLLDTCAAIWLAMDEPVSEPAIERLARSRAHGVPVYISPVTAWEIGMLIARQRLITSISPESLLMRLFTLQASLSPG